MLKNNASAIRKLLITFDAGIIVFSFVFSHLILRFLNKDITAFFSHTVFLLASVAIWISLLDVFGAYKSLRIRFIPDVLLVVFKCSCITFLLLTSAIYLFPTIGVGKFLFIITMLVTTLTVTFEKVFLILFSRYVRKKGYNYRNVLIVGTGKRAQKFISIVEQHAEWGFKIVGLIDEDIERKGKFVKDYKVLGDFDDIPYIMKNTVIDEVAFVVPRSWLERIEPVMHYCETQGLRLHVAVDYFDLALSHARQTDLQGFPLLTFDSTPNKIWQLLTKRLLDILISFSLLILFLPLMAIVSVLIKCTSSGPVLFRQSRCGLNGRIFTLYKFRTMVKDAHLLIDELRQHNEMTGPVFKMKNDPRLTTIGGILRKFSIDEFPQLWNVFKGDMSLIGPRPPIPDEVQKYDTWQRRRLSMIPGLSCLWQIEGRNRIVDFNEWMKLDLEYIDNWSLMLDIKIFCKTIPVVMFGIGAK